MTAARATAKWWTTAECCDWLGFTGAHRLRSMYRVIKRHGVPTARTSARRVLVDRQALLDATGAH